MAAVVPEEEQAPVMSEEAVMGQEEQTLSLVMEEREPARSEEAAAEAPYAEVHTGVVEGVVVEEGPAITNEMLRDWVKRWCCGDREGLPRIATWNTSEVTDMSYLFAVWQDWMNHASVSARYKNKKNIMLPASAVSFNDDISTWNTSNVTNMSFMFFNASSFNQPLNGWWVDKVTDMSWMFNNALAFNQPLNDWRVDNVTDMSGMFQEAHSFNQPLNDWRVDNVTDMHDMFAYATSFNQPLGGWQIRGGCDTGDMFSNTKFDGCTTENMSERIESSCCTVS